MGLVVVVVVVLLLLLWALVVGRLGTSNKVFDEGGLASGQEARRCIARQQH